MERLPRTLMRPDGLMPRNGHVDCQCRAVQHVTGDSEFEDCALVTRTADSGRTIEYSVGALDQCTRVTPVGTARKGIEHRLDSSHCDLEQGALAAYASANRRPVENAVGGLDQRNVRITPVGGTACK